MSSRNKHVNNSERTCLFPADSKYNSYFHVFGLILNSIDGNGSPLITVVLCLLQFCIGFVDVLVEKIQELKNNDGLDCKSLSAPTM